MGLCRITKKIPLQHYEGRSLVLSGTNKHLLHSTTIQLFCSFRVRPSISLVKDTRLYSRIYYIDQGTHSIYSLLPAVTNTSTSSVLLEQCCRHSVRGQGCWLLGLAQVHLFGTRNSTSNCPDANEENNISQYKGEQPYKWVSTVKFQESYNKILYFQPLPTTKKKKSKAKKYILYQSFILWKDE